jgi:hypothetical protein
LNEEYADSSVREHTLGSAREVSDSTVQKSISRTDTNRYFTVRIIRVHLLLAAALTGKIQLRSPLVVILVVKPLAYANNLWNANINSRQCFRSFT